MKEIPLTQGKASIVDDEDSEIVERHKWFALRGGHTFYGARGVRRQDGVWTTESMHRVILARKIGRPLVKGEMCDHVSGDGLDNRRENLRLATNAQNHRNLHRRRSHTSSKYLGVTWCKRDENWEAQIMINQKNINLGRYPTELTAAMAREVYIDAHPELQARSNFPKEAP
jgi:hypothetical protein